MLGIQVVAIVFGAFMLYLTFLHTKRTEFTIFEAGAWTILWSGIVYVSLFPNSLDFLVKNVLNLKRPLDFFIICGFLFLIFIVFFIYSKVRINDLKIQKMVTRFALTNSLDRITNVEKIKKNKDNTDSKESNIKEDEINH